MTLASELVKVSYNGDGSTTTFAVTFVFWSLDDLKVILTDANDVETVWTRGTQYEVTKDIPNGEASTGNVTVNTTPTDYTPASGEKLTIISNLPDTQGTSIPLGGPFPSSSVEEQLDKTTRIVQQGSEERGRAMKFAESEAAASIGDIPALATRKSQFLNFDANGKPTTSAGSGTDTGLRTDLADTADVAKGDALIGGKRTDTNATSFTGHEYHENRLRNVKTDYDAVGDDATDDRAKFANADTDGDFEVSSGTYKISSNITISNIMTFLPGAMLSIDSGITVTINDSIKTPIQQIFSGSGLVVFGLGSQPFVYPDYWGTAVGTIQKAVDAVSGKHIPVHLLAKNTYQFSSQLVVDEDYMTILGPTFPSHILTTDTVVGATLEYTGTSGTGFLIGINPDVNGTYIQGLNIGNFFLKVTQNTDIAMRVWHPIQCRFKPIMIFGNSDNDGSTNEGLKVEASQATVFDSVDIRGQGVGDTAGTAKYLGRGLHTALGFNNAPATTTRYKHVYLHYLLTGLFSRTNGYFDNIIIEAITTRSFDAQEAGAIHFKDFHTESTPEVAYIDGRKVYFDNRAIFNIGSDQTFFQIVSGAKVFFNKPEFTSTHANPAIYKNSNFTTGLVRFQFPTFPTNCTMTENCFGHRLVGIGIGSH